ncbi:Lrp/AsnC family transcriptional regulator [Microbacterium sp. 18062]|uniref:Lrp/AsnC family transcriptional regulator n=1 Tax=Microbacterium sp. 18062 TaxID=2681410 RepID=UPI00190FB31C|nr:Lrp/AsnC family transcriptional regulator [Microbacterium sp. 18062]
MDTIDAVDARLLLALDSDPRLPTAAIAEKLRLARRTVQLRLARLETEVYAPNSTRVAPRALGQPLRAVVNAEVHQSQLDSTVRALAAIPQVLQVAGVAGDWDLLCEVAAPDADGLYEVGQRILACPGIRRTATNLLLRDLVPYRTRPLIESGIR